MAEHPFGKAYAGTPPANYERFFVPLIGAPLATDLVRHAELRKGDRVLDVACGTGVVARLASDEVGNEGAVAALDVNAGMLAVARASTPEGVNIEWHEASAESIPLPDESFETVMCQMGLQFMTDKRAALLEMHRVLAPGGRLVLNVSGPTPQPFSVLRDGLARYVGADAAGFVDLVFSLYDADEIEQLFSGVDFRDLSLHSAMSSLPLPAPGEFLWQYVSSTPLSGAMERVDDQARASLDRDVVKSWRELTNDGAFTLDVQVTTATAFK
jgi:ubiquinone/menaquinone biosynthesis C-methylase UbiE